MKKHSPFIPILLVLSLVLPQSAPLLAAETNPTVVFDPPTVAPSEKFIAHAKGFAPQSTISITYKGATFGVDLYFAETQKKADTTGSVDFTGGVSDLDNGALSAENIQIGLTGVGWMTGKKKSIKAINPDEQPSAPQFFDLCEGAPCPEREDGLKLIAVFPRSTPSGSHTLIVSEEGGTDVRTTVVIPELPENKKEAGREAEIFLIDPPVATVDVLQIYVRGSGWGAYNDRRLVNAWLVDPDTEAFHELKVGANYRDCSFIKGDQKIGGGCLLETDELYLRLEIPENIKPALTPKKYFLFVQTEKNVRGGGVFTVTAQPTFDKKKGTSIAVIPDHGPVGANTLLFGAGFPKKQFIDVRFDGVYVRLGGALWPNDDGTFENIPLQIPRTITRAGKEITVTPGTHTISLSTKGAVATATFTVEGPTDEKKKEEEERDRIEREQKKLKEEEEKIKKEEERIEKDRKKLQEEVKKKEEEERKEKDKEDKERLEKDRKKLQEEVKKKEEEERKKEKQLKDIKEKKEKLEDLYCDPDRPITFQPGCVPQTKTEVSKPVVGEQCDPKLPRVWQEGCVDEKEKLKEQKPAVQYYVPDSTGKACKEGVAITFQPGCVSQTKEKPIEKSPQKPFMGEPCDPNLPRVWQEGCVDSSGKAKPVQQQTQAQVQAMVTIKEKEAPVCNPQVPTYTQPGCRKE